MRIRLKEFATDLDDAQLLVANLLYANEYSMFGSSEHCTMVAEELLKILTEPVGLCLPEEARPESQGGIDSCQS